jgi:hypothetical protein
VIIAVAELVEAKYVFFSSAVSEDWEIAQDASKCIRLLPLAATATF